jgi:hypothetical protein
MNYFYTVCLYYDYFLREKESRIGRLWEAPKVFDGGGGNKKFGGKPPVPPKDYLKYELDSP